MNGKDFDSKWKEQCNEKSARLLSNAFSNKP